MRLRPTLRPSLPRAASALRLWCRRLGWLAVIWAASVAAVGLVSWVLRLWLRA